MTNINLQIWAAHFSSRFNLSLAPSRSRPSRFNRSVSVDVCSSIWRRRRLGWSRMFRACSFGAYLGEDGARACVQETSYCIQPARGNPKSSSCSAYKTTVQRKDYYTASCSAYKTMVQRKDYYTASCSAYKTMVQRKDYYTARVEAATMDTANVVQWRTGLSIRVYSKHTSKPLNAFAQAV